MFATMLFQTKVMCLPIKSRHLILLAAGLLLLISAAWLTMREPQGICPYKPDLHGFKCADISYADSSDPFHTLNIFLPTGELHPRPTVMMIHGGAFVGGSKQFYDHLARDLGTEDYAFVSIDYRLAPRYPYPLPIQDAACALYWLQTEGTAYGLDPARVVVIGDSAGGYLAAMVGIAANSYSLQAGCSDKSIKTEPLRGIVTLYGVFDFTDPTYSRGSLLEDFAGFLGVKPNEFSDFVANHPETSPINHVDEHDAPFLLIHGLADTIVPPEESKRFAAALEAANAKVELILLPEGKHDIILNPDVPEYNSAITGIKNFLKAVFAD